MRSEEEMFRLFERIAAEDDRIRVMTLEGSRVNPHIKPDIWQDYDITFLVTDLESYMVSDEWRGSCFSSEAGSDDTVSSGFSGRMVLVSHAVPGWN